MLQANFLQGDHVAGQAGAAFEDLGVGSLQSEKVCTKISYPPMYKHFDFHLSIVYLAQQLQLDVRLQSAKTDFNLKKKRKH